MDPNELSKMLGLDDPAPAKGPLIVSQAKLLDVEHQAPSSFALKLDEWDLGRGRDLSATRSAEALPVEIGMNPWGDFHGAVYKEAPELVENCSDARRHEFVRNLLEDPEFAALRAGTVLDLAASEAATHQIAAKYAELIRKDQERQKKCKGRKLSPGQQKQEGVEAVGDLLAAVVGAAREAQEAVEEQQEACRSLGLGAGANDRIDPAAVGKLYKRVKGHPALKRITELAGKFRRLAQAKQRQKVSHGYDDVVGVELSGDVGRLLPSELAKLSDPDFEDDVLRRLVERQTMCREHRGAEPVGKGPVVIVVDESGSMKGEPVYAAKAFALAMAWVARKQGRWCGLVGFSGGSTGNLCVLPNKKWDEAALMDWLVHFYGGGTSCDVPLVELPYRYWQEMGAPRGKTDVVIITDGVINVPWDVRRSFNDWKAREKVRCTSLVMASAAGDLGSVSDEVHLVSGISVSEEAVGRCLSI